MPLGKNDLLEAAYRDLGRAAFRIELMICAVCAIAIYLLLRFL